jgi:Na+-transporting NADH:ubiquinone oxidoreductase subunit NqrF
MRPRTPAALQKMHGILRLPILVPPVPARADQPAGEFGAYIILLLSSDRTAVVGFPFANAFEFRGQKIAAYRIYIDESSLFAPAAQP